MTFRSEMNASILNNEGTDADRSSLRSSEASGSTGEVWRERIRLEQKIEAIKLKISRVNLSCEADVENFLQMSRDSEKSRGADNPQMARIKQHFEKNNKRNAQDLDSLQKKLASYEQRLCDLDTKDVLDTSSRSGNIVSNVGQGIRRTGATVREFTGTVISAPLDLAHMIRSSFGSADNVNDNAADVSNVGHSTFYARSENAAPAGSKSATLPPGMRMDAPSATTEPLERGKFPSTSFIASPDGNYYPRTNGTPELEGSSSGSAGDEKAPEGEPIEKDLTTMVKDMMVELRAQKETNQLLSKQMAELSEFVQKELKFFEKSLQEDRFRYQKLEDQMNETIDLHQAEVNLVRQELGGIANRLDYQYNDRFKRVEESVESAQNHMFRVETSLRESLDLRLQGTAWWNSMVMAGGSVLVELIKLVLFLTATVLDFFKPFTGTRTRTGFLLTVLLGVFLLCRYIDFSQLFSPGKKRTDSPGEL